jgi:hypothetical protein
MNAAPTRATRCALPTKRVGFAESALKLGGDDRVDVPRLVAAGVADGLLAAPVGPAGAVREHLPVVAAEHVAHDVA